MSHFNRMVILLKKATLYIVLLLSVFFFACANGSNSTLQEGDHPLPNDKTAETADYKSPPETSNEYEVEYPLLTINSLQEYDEFLKEKADKQNLIPYDLLQEIGTFQGITFLSNVKAGDYSHYMYKLRDASGYTLYLYVKTGNVQEDNRKELKEEQINPQNLRMLKDKSDGTYVYEGYEYHYINGELLSIRWGNEVFSFVLTGEPMLSDYPINETTTLSFLLSTNTVSATKTLLQTICSK